MGIAADMRVAGGLKLRLCGPGAAQDVFNLLPNLNMGELTRSFSVKSNDMMLVIYMSSLIRSVLALHDLIDNREVRLLASTLLRMYMPGRPPPSPLPSRFIPLPVAQMLTTIGEGHIISFNSARHVLPAL